MSARFDLEGSRSQQLDSNAARVPYLQVAGREPTGARAEYASVSQNTAEPYLPATKITDLHCACSSDSSGQPAKERQDWHDARQKQIATYEDKFCRGQSVTLKYGATLWDVATAWLKVKEGHQPSQQEVARKALDLMKELNVGPCDNIAGKTVKAPPDGRCGGGATTDTGTGSTSTPEGPSATAPGDRPHPKTPSDSATRTPEGPSGVSPGDRRTPNEPNGAAPPENSASEYGCPTGSRHHGRVEKHGNVTTIKEDNGATQSIKCDDKGNPIEVTRQGGHWAQSGLKQEHFKKTGEHEWTSDNGSKWHGDVKLGPDGTYSYTDLDHGFTKTFRPDGSRYDQTLDGKKTFIQSTDGAHQHSYLRGKDGKWQESPGGEKFDDVQINDGTVVARGKGITKELRPDGSQVDTDDQGRRTFIQTPDGPNQKFYIKDAHRGKWIDAKTKEEYADVQMDSNGTITLKDK